MKRGPKPKELIKIKWSGNFAYAMGLLATDGCLANDGLLIDLTSKDKQQLENFMKCVGVRFKIGEKFSGKGNKCLRIQFKNRVFYDFLLSIGFTSAKSKTIKKINIPEEYFFDFLRGCLDGDGYTYSYWDPRWKSSYMLYVGFVSASKSFIDWIRKKTKKELDIWGHVTVVHGKSDYYQLKYAKKESIILLKRIYKEAEVCLIRKRLKVEHAFVIVGESL